MKYLTTSLIAAILVNFHPAQCNPDDDIYSEDGGHSQGTPPTLPYPDEWSDDDSQDTISLGSPCSMPLSFSSLSQTLQNSPPPPPQPGRRVDAANIKRQNAGFIQPGETLQQWHERLLVPHPAGPGNRGAKVF